MKVSSTSFVDGEKLPPGLALAVAADPGPVAFSGNRNPHLTWSDAPNGTKSFVVTCIDHDSPSSPDDVNRSDREVPGTLPRVDFTHWLLVDIPADTTEIAEGAHSDEVTKRGKAATAAPIGVHGQNDYTSWFVGDPTLEGRWHGYDGSAPPWNDSIVHRYEFSVYAIDTESLDLEPGFVLDELVVAMDAHILGSTSMIGLYTSNRRLL